jgi:heat shock protein HslJ
VRPPEAAADRAVTEAGWRLLGAPLRSGDTEVVGGQSGFDGMCRPRGYQFFVFSGGRFAGTLSPVPMDARREGAAQLPRLVSPAEVTVAFSRYAPSDPLCCPSRTTWVDYRIRQAPDGPVLVPVAASTAPAGEPRPTAPTAIVGRAWRLERIRMMDDTVHVPDPPDGYTLVLRGDGRAEVRADCNRGTASYALSGSALTFGPFATTRAMCPPGSLSDRYLQQLGQVASWMQREGRLHLATRADGAILEFQPAGGLQ